ncbi:Uncharacterised protein [Mycobacteroides abscessus subsp. abscessus]|nr:Uncharacterised protein [Mycobacteroides abscessus subsp. abscessus]
MFRGSSVKVLAAAASSRAARLRRRMTNEAML